MTIYEATVAKIQQMPETMILEVQDFVDFLLTRKDRKQREANLSSEASSLVECDLSDYLLNLEAYEDQLVRGEVKW